jgi:putative phosphoesterase
MRMAKRRLDSSAGLRKLVHMRIAAIADTHNRVPPVLPELIAEADEIWHLGDVCDESMLETFTAIGPAVKVVRGNCDACISWPLTLDFLIAGKKIRLVHVPPEKAPPGIDVLLHGHTHVPRNERVVLNPGCVTRPNRGAPPSFAWLELNDGQPLSWQLHRLR